jgi:hypothetical protein
MKQMLLHHREALQRRNLTWNETDPQNGSSVLTHPVLKTFRQGYKQILLFLMAWLSIAISTINAQATSARRELLSGWCSENSGFIPFVYPYATWIHNALRSMFSRNSQDHPIGPQVDGTHDTVKTKRNNPDSLVNIVPVWRQSAKGEALKELLKKVFGKIFDRIYFLFVRLRRRFKKRPK